MKTPTQLYDGHATDDSASTLSFPFHGKAVGSSVRGVRACIKPVNSTPSRDDRTGGFDRALPELGSGETGSL